MFVVAINYTINDKDSRRFEPVKPVFKSVREKQSVAYFVLHSLKFSIEVISCSNIDLNIFKQKQHRNARHKCQLLVFAYMQEQPLPTESIGRL